MARFPEREADIKALAQSIISGLTNNPDFPNPPFTPAQLQTLLDSLVSLGDTQVADQAKAQQSTEAKQHGQEETASALKSVLRYAENAVDGNHAKLTVLGWGGPVARTPLQVPSQPRSLEAPRQGAGWIFLDWKAPADGGRPASYRIERRKLPGAGTGKPWAWPWTHRGHAQQSGARQGIRVPGHRGQQSRRRRAEQCGGGGAVKY